MTVEVYTRQEVDALLGQLAVSLQGPQGPQGGQGEPGSAGSSVVCTTLDELQDAFSAGEKHICLKGQHTLSSTLVVPADTRLWGYPGAKLTADGDFNAVELGARALLARLEIEGPGNNVYAAASRGVYQAGINNAPAAPTYVDGGTVYDCYIHGFRNAGIEFRYVNRPVVLHSRIEDCTYAGIACISVKGDGEVAFNRIKNISPGESSSCYGMFFSKNYGTETAFPASRDMWVHHNVVRDVPIWHGFDTHGGINIKFEDNEAYNCYRAFVCTYNEIYSPMRSGFTRCRAYWAPLNKADRGEAFWIIGAPGSYAEDCYIDDCYANSYGYERVAQNSTIGAVYMSRTKRAKVNATLITPLGDGVYLAADNYDFDIDCTIKDPNSDRIFAAYVRVAGNNNTGFVGGMFLREDAGIGTYVGSHGFQVMSGLTGVAVKFSPKRNAALTPTQVGSTNSVY